MFDTTEDQLAALLQGTVAQLDIPTELHRLAVEKYRGVASHLGAGDEFNDADLAIYPQGSFRLGTVVLPTPGADYDIDLVFSIAISKTTVSQAELKALAGDRLAQFVRSNPFDAPTINEGGRCWILEWPRFHMDVLPCIPNPENRPTGLLLTDRDLHRWQSSDPIGFADWFHDRMRDEFVILRKAMAADRSVHVEDVRPWEIKTTLQRAVQVLKRHRDLYFQTHPKDKPPSILLTTLAGRAYRGEDNVFDAVVNIAPRMGQFVEQRDGVGWVANPVLEEENFADKWRGHPDRQRWFESWIQQVNQDLEQAASERGLDRVVARLSKSFGAEVGKAAETLGVTYREGRRGGTLTSASVTGALALGTKRHSRAVRDHTFYGRD